MAVVSGADCLSRAFAFLLAVACNVLGVSNGGVHRCGPVFLPNVSKN